MSRPTPETDARTYVPSLGASTVPAKFARKLERKRNEAREELRQWQTLRLWGGTPEHIHDFIKGQQTRIHEAQNIERTCEQLESQRDEALAQVKELIYIADRAIDLAEIDFENDKIKEETK